MMAFGVADEQENIEVLEIPFHEAEDMIASGKNKMRKPSCCWSFRKSMVS